MRLIQFKEQTTIIAKDQPQYMPMPVWRLSGDIQGRIICCWKLTFWERIWLLFTGKIWHHILTFNDPVQPQLLEAIYPFTK
jgi:hypothetical protein